MRGVLGLIIAMATLTAVAAQAQTPSPAGAGDELTGPCRADVAKLCSGVEPGGGRMKQCLRDHATELSPGCRKTLRELAKESAAGGNRAWLRACRNDVDTACPGVEPGGGRIIACLRSHADKVSPACKAALPAE
ncbi:MAG: cysteine rich repeat-containing protein [bacterium]